MTADTDIAASKEHSALASATRLLLDARNEAGHWVGELSSSALSTATALFALHLCSDPRHRDMVNNGIAWLTAHQNEDGGWGDTTLSISNISTTALCWAALSVADDQAAPAIERARQWLARAAGSLQPADLARAIAARYGKDRTFSVPILTMCALAGRLGNRNEAWRNIAQLPFELAAFPQSWYRFFRLPVVSYALPALIAMGLARHHHRPTRNPLARLVRKLTTSRVLKVLSNIQPQGGGFLEATPLTSFVAMSLIGAGHADHPVVRNCVDFLARSARSDGSWPIDTNLATWVTTLSVNALAAGGTNDLSKRMSDSERDAIRNWLLDQQYAVRHPYTGAPPGAWAWTDLPGGVPDADDTAGALLALHHLGGADHRTLQAVEAGISWLLDLQNSDGGIPTFCRGWTNLPFDRSGADLTAHALQAFRAWHDRLPTGLAASVDAAARRALNYLSRQQRPDGSWLPLWFGNQFAPDDENPTYGTCKVLLALLGHDAPPVQAVAAKGVQWLVGSQDADGGWGGAASTPSSIEETSLAIEALSLAITANSPSTDQRIAAAIDRGCDWLIARTESGRRFDPSPIGFYFARLWYFERTYPLLMTIAALGRAAAARHPVTERP